MFMKKYLLALFFVVPMLALSSCVTSQLSLSQSSTTTSATTSEVSTSAITSSEDDSSESSSSEEPVEYTLTFEENGGSEVTNVTLPAGSVLTAPEEPTKTGHIFDGWFADIELTMPFVFDFMPEANTTIYAKWLINQYTITLDLDGGAGIDEITQDYGFSVSEPTPPTKLGYTFDGWYANEMMTVPYAFTTMPENDITVYAAWTVNQYTITFESTGGTPVDPLTADYGASISAPDAPTNIGHTFGGWYTEVELTTPFVFDMMPAEDITVFAKWTVNQYTITFALDGGSAIPSITQDYGSPVSAPPAPTKVGYGFGGWFADAVKTIPYTFTTIPAENITVYAKWNINQYTISFDSMGGTAVTSITEDFGTIISAPDEPTKEGYLFTGWFFDDLTTNPYFFTTMPAEDITVYAGWVEDYYFGMMSIADFIALPDEDVSLHEVAGIVIVGGVDIGTLVFADETGVLLAMTDDVVEVGDLVQVSGYRMVFDGKPIMVGDEGGPAIVNIRSHDLPIPITPEQMTVAEYNLLDPALAINWIRYVEIHGNLTIDEETHMFILTDGSDVLQFNVLSMEAYLYLENYRDFDVIIRGVILPMNDEGMPPELMFLYNGHEAFISLDYTNAELLGYLETLFLSYYGTATYFPGQIVDLPYDHDIILLSLDYVTFGPNAALFDLETLQIDPDISEPLDIGIEVTMRLEPDLASSTFELLLHVDPSIITTIAEFKTMPDSETTFYVIEAVIIYIQIEEEGVMYLVADETGICYINSNDPTHLVGERVIAIGVKMTMDPFAFLANDPSKTINIVLDYDNPMPLAPTPMTLVDFGAMDVSLPETNMQYIALSGTLVYSNPSDPINSQLILNDGNESGETVIIYTNDPNVRATLVEYIYTSVTIHGLSMVVGNPGSEMIILVFLNYPNTIIPNN